MKSAPLDREQLDLLLRQAGERLEQAGYAGKDPYQLDQAMTRASKFKLLRPAIRVARKALKPFHAFIPPRLFEMSRPVVIPQALGDVLSAEASLPAGDEPRRRAQRVLRLLDASRSSGDGAYGWGLPFEWGGTEPHPPGWPTTITTAIVVNGLLDAEHLLGRDAVASRVGPALRLLLEVIGCEETGDGVCIRFGPGDTRLILNVSAVGALALARAAPVLDRPDYLDVADRAMALVVAHQNQNGSWFYAPPHGPHPLDTIIDSRHTGYILESLAHFQRLLPRPAIQAALDRGWAYHEKTLLEGPAPRWSPEQTFPIDSHDLAQAIQTALALGRQGLAERHAEYAFGTFHRGGGRFAYKVYADGSSNDADFIRWTQAPMYKAFARLRAAWAGA